MAGFYWTLEQLAHATGGELVFPSATSAGKSVAHVNGFARVVTDNRTVASAVQTVQKEFVAEGQDESEGSAITVLYIAVVGPRFNGHDFIASAIQAGAGAVLVSQKDPNCPVPQVVVQDTRLALGQFARWHRQQMPVKAVVGITGSNGKTTTKTLVAKLLTTVGKTLMTQGNLNNDFGVPRTLLALRPEHAFAVIEMGANHQGEIAYLTRLVEPDIALLNNAGPAHLEGFGSLEGVIAGKGEIFEGVRADSPWQVAIINADSPGIEQWRQRLHHLPIAQVIEFSKCDPDSQKYLASPNLTELDLLSQHICWQACPSEKISERNRFVLKFSHNELSAIEVDMPLMGEHNAYNAAASVAVAQLLGVSSAQIKQVLNAFSGVSGRQQMLSLRCGQLIDDSYNANPASVKAGIDVLTALKGEAVVCLGEMAELGQEAGQAQAEIAEYALQKGVKALFYFSPSQVSSDQVTAKFLQFAKASGSAEVSVYAQTFNSQQALFKDLVAYLNRPVAKQKMNILVKGSRSAQMELVSQQLLTYFSD